MALSKEERNNIYAAILGMDTGEAAGELIQQLQADDKEVLGKLEESDAGFETATAQAQTYKEKYENLKQRYVSMFKEQEPENEEEEEKPKGWKMLDI